MVVCRTRKRVSWYFISWRFLKAIASVRKWWPVSVVLPRSCLVSKLNCLVKKVAPTLGKRYWWLVVVRRGVVLVILWTGQGINSFGVSTRELHAYLKIGLANAFVGLKIELRWTVGARTTEIKLCIWHTQIWGCRSAETRGARALEGRKPELRLRYHVVWRNRTGTKTSLLLLGRVGLSFGHRGVTRITHV